MRRAVPGWLIQDARVVRVKGATVVDGLDLLGAEGDIDLVIPSVALPKWPFVGDVLENYSVITVFASLADHIVRRRREIAIALFDYFKRPHLVFV